MCSFLDYPNRYAITYPRSVFEQLPSRLRFPVYSMSYSSSQSIHEAIKAQLYVMGFALHYQPILEATIGLPARGGRIDCVFLDRGEAVCGFEVDSADRKKSIDKLCALPRDAEKIIISFGSADSWLSTLAAVANNDVKVFRLCANNK